MSRGYRMRILALLLAFASISSAAGSALFDDESPLEIVLHGPLSTVLEQRNDPVEQAFVLSVDQQRLPVKVRARGNSRLRVCDFPPLRLNFARDTAANSVFAGQDKIKLVTHCKTGRRDTGAVLDEYLAYRIFNLLSDYSYRTRLVRVRYEDTEQDENEEVFDGFLIESDEEFATRTSGTIEQVPAVRYSQLNDRQATIIYVYQYLIANTDWSLVAAIDDDNCCHNGDLYRINQQLVLVPYDFDLSGLVNASYAKPDSSLRIRSVRSRIYRGYCTDPETLRDALHHVKANQATIMQLVNTIPAATKKKLEARQRLVSDFFKKTEKEEKLLKRFNRRCLGSVVVPRLQPA